MTKEERDKKLVAWYPLIELVVNRFLQVRGYHHLRQHREDMVSEGVFALIDGIESYDEEAGSSESSWYSQKIKSKLTHYIRDFEETGCTPWDISIDDLLKDEDKYSEYITYTPQVTEDSEIVDKYEPNGRVDREIYHRILMGDSTTYQEIADEEGTSRRGIVRRKQRLVKRLRKQMEQDNILEEDVE